jgi:hypothetical protein
MHRSLRVVIAHNCRPSAWDWNVARAGEAKHQQPSLAAVLIEPLGRIEECHISIWRCRVKIHTIRHISFQQHDILASPWPRKHAQKPSDRRWARTVSLRISESHFDLPLMD